MNYGNVHFTFDQIIEEYAGESRYAMPMEAFLEVKKYADEHEPNMWHGFDDILSDHEGDHRVCFLDSDIFIYCIFALDDIDYEQVTIECSYSHIMWLFHDISHAHNDCTEGGIYVEGYSETRAVEYSIDVCLANDIAIPYDSLHNVDILFEKRFDYASGFVEYARARDKKNYNTLQINFQESLA